MKAIETRYVPATDTRGSKIRAEDCDGHTVTISYPYHLSGEKVHRLAARALCRKLGWTGRLAGGATRHGYAFVFIGGAK